MNFREAENYLYSLGNEVVTMKLGLENIRKLLEALGNPQNNYLKVQVAGTNGKGSVCAFLDSICNTAGIKTGTFTSPHLVSITERIRINGSDISEEDFARHANRVRELAEQLLAADELEYRPTFFEQITAIALVAFAEAGVEVAILETGLGGRLDATTAANSEIAAITRIDLDHQEYLGDTIEKIAAEKAAIIHANSKVVVGDQLPSAMKVIQEQCSRFGLTAITECDASIWAIDTVNRSVVAAFRTPNGYYDDPSLGLSGRHQLENARVAVLACEALIFDFCRLITTDHIYEGLENARHPGRLEYQGRYLLDGAHNAGGAKALADYIGEFEKRSITLLFGAMRGKNIADMLSIFEPLSERIILTEPTNSRSMPYDELLNCLPVNCTRERVFATDAVTNAIEIAETVTPDGGLILVTGSLYLVGEVKKILQSQI